MESNFKDWIYFKFQSLPQEVRDKFNIKSSNRIDCIRVYNPTGHKGLTFFVNNKNQLFLYKALPKSFIHTDIRRQADWTLIGKSINLTSVYSYLHAKGFGYGNPPYSKMLGSKKNKPNPLFTWKDDLYLFLYNEELTTIELIVIPNGKSLWNTYFSKLVNGDFDKIIQSMRDASKPFFDYGL